MIRLGCIDLLRKLLRVERKPYTFIVKSEVLEKLLESPVWAPRFKAANSTEERFKVTQAYCQEQGLKVIELNRIDREGQEVAEW